MKPIKVTVTDHDGVIFNQIEIDVAKAAKIIAGVKKRKGKQRAAVALLEFSRGAIEEIEDEVRRAVVRALKEKS